ncbi:MAG: alkaline phosphatase family protein [Planctomycetota bacterium]|nr:MAG: alkaline phosphatase family protein [Planctomycetota bacterium]
MKFPPLLILNIVGLDNQLLERTTYLKRFAQSGQKCQLIPPLPAVTCTSQANLLTGTTPREHGIVGNGWYFRELAEVFFWRQSNFLVQSPPFWDTFKARFPQLRVAKLFWWFNMYSSADISVTPRPAYPADGRKIPDLYTTPPDLGEELQSKWGTFPLFHFWGPLANLKSSQWITQAALDIFERFCPHITLVYLPHLDYNLQRLGPQDPKISQDVEEIDRLAHQLLPAWQEKDAAIVVLSEYSIFPVQQPIFLNRILRQEGWLRVQNKKHVGELLDCGASRAFAVCDHQIAHVYVKNPSDIPPLRQLLEEVEGVEMVLDQEGKRHYHLDHPRSGELVAVAQTNSWFAYYYWEKDECAPDFARTVDIHRKPGYDPVELFFDPQIPFLQLRILYKLLRKHLGFRTLMDLIPLDAYLVKGSHGARPQEGQPYPIFLCNQKLSLPERIRTQEAHQAILQICQNLFR